MSFPLSWPVIITSLLEHSDLSVSEATWCMEQVMVGAVTPVQLAGFLVALRAKGESVDEIIGFRDAVLAHALGPAVPPMALDIVGTGGDRRGTVNVSTMAAIVCAAAGVPVVKHGNRAASSASGSSDVLQALGVNLDLSPDQVARVFDEVSITFIFAAVFHPGFRHAAQVRSELGIPTVFNYLGPLCNPARPEASAVGVADPDRVPLFVGVFQTRGATALVFRGDDGLDELTTTGPSHLWEITRGRVKEHDIDPRELGITRAHVDDLAGGDPAWNAAIIRDTFAGKPGPIRDIVVLNAAAGMVAYALARDPAESERPVTERLVESMAAAAAAIDSAAAATKLDQWIQATHSARELG